MPCTWNTFLAISKPIVVICMWTAPSCDSIATITLRRFVAGSGRRPPHQNLCDEVLAVLDRYRESRLLIVLERDLLRQHDVTLGKIGKSPLGSGSIHQLFSASAGRSTMRRG